MHSIQLKRETVIHLKTQLLQLSMQSLHFFKINGLARLHSVNLFRQLCS